MTVTAMKTKAEQQLAAQFADLLGTLPGTEATRRRRREAFARFERTGLPSRRLESWHYTDWKAMIAEALQPGGIVSDTDLASASADTGPLFDPKLPGLLIINDLMAASTGMPDGVEVVNLATALSQGHPLIDRIGTVFSANSDPMAALNEAMYSGGVLVRIGRGVKVAGTMFANNTFVSADPRAFSARALVVVEDDAELTVVDSISGAAQGGSQVSTVVEFILGDRARVEYVTLNAMDDRAKVVTGLGVHLGREAQFETINFALGGKASRHQIHATLAGENARLRLNGVSLIRGEQHADTTLVVDHQAPGCESRELFRTVADGEGTGVFQGKIIVRQAAQQTDGQMASNAILLSDGATMNNKPELEIFADDVQCAHGATCGALDDELLFYLQARGLPRAEAEAVMVQAFLGEVLEAVSDETVRDKLNGLVADWLAVRSAA